MKFFQLCKATWKLESQMWLRILNNPITVTDILEQLKISGKNFNSLSVINDQGIAIATTPNVGLVGNKITSVGVKEALARKEAFISKPYYAQTGRLLILICTPVVWRQWEIHRYT